MRERSPKIFFEDIQDSIEKIERYTKDLTYETWAKKDMGIDAVIRNLEIIWEAANNIPENVKLKYHNVPWKRMIGLRNIAIHKYFGLDLSIIWEIVSRNLPETKPMIAKILKEIE